MVTLAVSAVRTQARELAHPSRVLCKIYLLDLVSLETEHLGVYLYI